MLSIVIPRCPQCRYDLSGAAALWAESCPLRTQCPECGVESDSSKLFDPEEVGPRWSFEHCVRRFARKWARTTCVSLLPSKLWSDISREHPVRGRRLAALALSWAALFHITCGVMVAISDFLGAVASSSSGSVNAAWNWWWFWKQVLRGIVWPYPRMIERYTSATTSMGNPVYDLVVITIGPMAFTAILTAVFVWWPRSKRIDAPHIARAAVMSLPMASPLFVLNVFGMFVGMSAAEGGSALLRELCFVGTIVCDVLYLAWWWRCFASRYCGRGRGLWLISVFAFASLFLTLLTAAGVVSMIEALSR